MSNLNLAANLQYNSQRWYDAGAGLNLQPGSFGGAPVGSGSLGMPGLPRGHAYIPRVSSSGWNYNLLPDVVGIIKTWADKRYKVQIGQALERLIPRRYNIPVNYGTALISLSTSKDTLSNPRFTSLLDSLNGRVSWTSSNLVRLNIPIKGVLDFEAEAGRLAQSFEPFGEVTRVQGFARGFDLAAEGIDPKVVVRLGKVLGASLDVGIGAGFQLYEDWDNPNLTGYQKAYRAGVSGGGSALFAGVAAAIFCGETGGVGCLIIAGVGGGLVWSEVGQPIVFENLFPLELSLFW